MLAHKGRKSPTSSKATTSMRTGAALKELIINLTDSDTKKAGGDRLGKELYWNL